MSGRPVKDQDHLSAVRPASADNIRSVVFMVAPPVFYLNTITAQDNAYQRTALTDRDAAVIAAESEQAKGEHRAIQEALRSAGVCVLPMDGPAGKPDAIFPNNSFSLHVRDGQLLAILYPMSPGRRDELPEQFIDYLKELCGGNFHDLRHYERQGLYLEGTGAINFSADGTRLYMGRSNRAHETVLADVAVLLGIAPENAYLFDIFDQHGEAIYHTNVMSWFGKDIIGICFDAIPDGAEKDRLTAHIRQTYAHVVELSFAEVSGFAGNALEVIAADGTGVLTISRSGWEALTSANKAIIQNYYGDHIVVVDISTIEKLGGGSIRCTQAKNNVPEEYLKEILEKFSSGVSAQI